MFKVMEVEGFFLGKFLYMEEASADLYMGMEGRAKVRCGCAEMNEQDRAK